MSDGRVMYTQEVRKQKAKTRNRRRERQLGFQFKERNKHGGKRKGAGRKQTLPGPRRVAHRTRPKLASRFPVHVTSRLRKDVGQMRNRPRCRLIREAMFEVSDEPGFRICEFSIERHHLHLVCEAKSTDALARGIKRQGASMSNNERRALSTKLLGEQAPPLSTAITW